MKKNLNYSEIAKILTNASWDYSYNMQRINEAKMMQLIGELDNATFTEKDVIKGLGENGEKEILNDCSEHDDVNDFAAKYIADAVAQGKVYCDYETVTFNII